MARKRTSTYDHERRLSTPFILLMLCLLALVVSLIGLYRTNTITHERVADLQTSWEAFMEDGLDGAELLTTDRLMRTIARPVPAAQAAAGWSLAMAALTLVFIGWLIVTTRSAEKARSNDAHNSERNEQAAMAKLLDEMAPIASGDLGVRATVRSGTPGALADTFNYAVGELQRLTAAKYTTSRSVIEIVKKTQAAGRAIEQRCIDQSDLIHRSSNLLLGMSRTASELSADTADMGQSIAGTVEHTDSGLKTLRTGWRQMHAGCARANDSLKHMQSLASHSLHMEKSVVQLEDVARRAHVLTLNTTLRATAADTRNSSAHPQSIMGDWSGELMTLVEEMNSISKDITTSIGHLRISESEATAFMHSVLTDYEEQQQQVGQLDNMLQLVQSDVQGLQKHVYTMAEQTVQYGGVVRELSGNMDIVNQITQDTIDDMRIHADHLDELRKLSNESWQNLSDFNMPDNDEGDDTPVKSKKSARRAAERAVLNG